MARRRVGVMAAVLIIASMVVGCANLIGGTPTWPGATLDKVLLTESDFPSGVRFDRIVDSPGEPDNAGGPQTMLSIPSGCSNGLTDVIASTAERGPGAAAKYAVTYANTRILMTVLTSQLNLDELAATASRCAEFEAFFDPDSIGIPISTSELPDARPGQLVYQQTMTLGGDDSSVFMSFENIDRMAVFGVAFAGVETSDQPANLPKASLPQTFIEIAERQAHRIASA